MNALIFLIDVFSRLFLISLLLRLLLQVARADFYNPVAQFIVHMTNPVVVPARRIIPSLRSFDLPTLVVMFFVQLLVIVLIDALRGFIPTAVSLLVATLFTLLELTIWTLLIAIFVIVILSWLGQGFHPISQLFGQIVEPLLRPVRRRLPAVSGVDFSPMVVGILLWAALILIADLKAPLL